MTISKEELEGDLRKVREEIAAIIGKARSVTDQAELIQLHQALKALQASRDQLEQWATEVAAHEISGKAEEVMRLAIDNERRRVENVLAGLKGAVKAVVRSVRTMDKVIEPEPEIIQVEKAEVAPPIVEAPEESDPALMRYIPQKRGVFGHLVGVMQRKLNASGHDVGTVDFDFGSATAKALKSWHKAAGFDEPAALSVNEWRLLTGEDAPDLFDLCAQVTAAFEGHGFGKIVGDFDGAVATWGCHGFTLKYGHLQNVLKLTEERAPGVLAEIFGEERGAALREMLSLSLDDQIAWGKANLLQANGAVRADWAEGFAELGARLVCQKAQIDYSRAEFWERLAVPQAKKLGLSEGLSLAMMFDTAIQQHGFSAGGLNALLDAFAQNPKLDEQGKRALIAEAAASRASGRFRADVKARRGTLINGAGQVHGGKYELSGWGLLAAFDENETRLSAGVNQMAPLVSFSADESFHDWFKANVKPIAKNFEPDEFLRMGNSNTPGAPCAGKNTEPPRHLWDNCIKLAEVLQKFRERIGAPVTVLNMYRSPAYNACVGGAAKSQHMQYRAADIVAATGSPRTWRAELRKLRAEGVFSGGIGLYGGFVHVDVRGTNADWVE